MLHDDGDCRTGFPSFDEELRLFGSWKKMTIDRMCERENDETLPHASQKMYTQARRCQCQWLVMVLSNEAYGMRRIRIQTPRRDVVSNTGYAIANTHFPLTNCQRCQSSRMDFTMRW